MTGWRPWCRRWRCKPVSSAVKRLTRGSSTGGGGFDDGEVLDDLGAARRSELARLLPELGAAAPAIEPADHRTLFESVAVLLQGMAVRRPLVMVVEDLHWADDMSVRLLAFLGRRLRRCPLLLVVTLRPDELADVHVARRALEDLADEGRLDEVPLTPLSRAETLDLVRALVRADRAESTTGLGEQVWATSEGNPFMVVETVRVLADGGEFRWPAGPMLPHRVRDVIERRLERLSAPARALVAAAAVVGREFGAREARTERPRTWPWPPGCPAR